MAQHARDCSSGPASVPEAHPSPPVTGRPGNTRKSWKYLKPKALRAAQAGLMLTGHARIITAPARWIRALPSKWFRAQAALCMTTTPPSPPPPTPPPATTTTTTTTTTKYNYYYYYYYYHYLLLLLLLRLLLLLLLSEPIEIIKRVLFKLLLIDNYVYYYCKRITIRVSTTSYHRIFFKLLLEVLGRALPTFPQAGSEWPQTLPARRVGWGGGVIGAVGF